jgi:hypothetical protein
MPHAILAPILLREKTASAAFDRRDVADAEVRGFRFFQEVLMNAFASAMIFAAATLLGTHQAFAETWTYTGADRFSFIAGAYRSQGVATDGTQWFFSWQYGLERTTPDYRELARNSSIAGLRSGIPESIAALGGNHIGDIDYHAGKIYAPIEDNPDYRNPVIAVYDAATLAYTGEYHLLPQSDLNGGVPWVAVDGARNLAYTAEWDPALRLNVYRLSDFSPIGYIALKQPLGRLQGAKVRGDYLYAASDNAAKSVYRISLIDGSVNELLRLGQLREPQDADRDEIEGLSFLKTASGETLNVLMSHGDRNNPFGSYTMFFHFALTQ